MKNTKPWRQIREERSKLSPAERASIDTKAKTEAGRICMTLDQLRKARHKTQHQLAEQLGTNQGALSRLERSGDLFVSTLRRFVEATGGELEIVARFPDGAAIEVNIFEAEEPEPKTPARAVAYA